MESWIEVIDGYKVSNPGEVYSTKTNKILKKHTDRYGYLYVGVYIDGRLWASTREIEQTLGFSNTSISACCRGFAKDCHSGKVYPVHQAFGYKWKYKNNE